MSPYPKINNEADYSLKKEDRLSRGVLISLGLHVAFFVFFMVKSFFIKSEAIDYQAAIRVDMVALPDKIEPQQKAESAPKEDPKPKPPKDETKPVEKPVEKPEVKLPPKNAVDPEALNLDKTKKKQQDALNRLKSMSAIDEIKKQVESEKKIAGLDAKKTKPVQYKGNVLSAGTELTGLNKLQHDNYVADLDRHIKQNWALPQWLAKKDLRAQVLLKIDEKGQIVARFIQKSSGNRNYDDVVLETIDKSAPFPQPPEKFIAILGERGILIGFPE